MIFSKSTKVKHQTGAVLVMSLMMLFVLTLLGVSSINTTSLQEKMAGNSRNRQVAFQSAESAIRDAERFITNSINNPSVQFTNAGTGGLYTLSNGPSTTDAVTKTWWTANNKKSFDAYATGNPDVPAAPQYTIEFVGETKQAEATDGNIFGSEEARGGQGSIFAFRITARGTGLTTNSVVVIQSHFGKRI